MRYTCIYINIHRKFGTCHVKWIVGTITCAILVAIDDFVWRPVS